MPTESVPAQDLLPGRPSRPTRENCTCDYCTFQNNTEIPPCWDFRPTKETPIWSRIFLFLVRHSLCLLAYGRTNMDEVWFHVQPKHTKEWEECLKKLNERLANQNIVGGLLLATTAVFLTTTPPKLDFVDYTANASYMLILASFAITIGSILSGAAIQFVLTHIPADRFCSNLCISRSRVLVTMWVLCYPLLSVAVSGSVFALGVLLGAIGPKQNIVIWMAFLALFVPINLLAFFLWMAIIPSSKEDWYKKRFHAASTRT